MMFRVNILYSFFSKTFKQIFIILKIWNYSQNIFSAQMKAKNEVKCKNLSIASLKRRQIGTNDITNYTDGSEWISLHHLESYNYSDLRRIVTF